MNEINNYVIEEFANKVFAAQKTNQKTVVLDIKEAQTLVQNLTIVLARATGQMDKALANATEASPDITIKMDGGGF